MSSAEIAMPGFQRDAFAVEFALPLLATAVFVLHYVTVDTWAVGAARTPYKLMYPFTVEAAYANKLQPFLRALRAQQNQVEQSWAFLAAMWACAFALSATFAGCCGCLWVLSRMAYGYIYRVTASRNKLMFATVPAYLAQLACCGGIFAAVLAPLLKQWAAWAATGIVVAFVLYGWFGYRRWYTDFVADEKEHFESEIGE